VFDERTDLIAVGDGVSSGELAQTVVRTLNIPEIAALRSWLIPEHTIYGSQVYGDSEIIVSGIADAVAYDREGRIETIVDSKSDVELDTERLRAYRRQLDAYQQQTGARSALLISDDDRRKNHGHRLAAHSRGTLLRL
jgi:hypothetical protein